MYRIIIITALFFTYYNGQAQQELKDACTLLSDQQIEHLLGTSISDIKNEDMSFGSKRSICYFYTAAGDKKLYVRYAIKSERSIERKALENTYHHYLHPETTEPIYKEIPASDDQQVLYAIKKDAQGKSIHHIRKRYGNAAEVEIEVTLPELDESMQQTLLDYLDGIK